MTKRHLFVVPTAKINGAERVLFNLASYLLRKGDHITLVTMSRGKSTDGWNELERYSSFKWIIGTRGSEKASLLPITTQLFKLNLSEDFDYLLSTHIHVNYYLTTLKRLGLFKKAKLISRDSHAPFERYESYTKIITYKLIYRYLYGKQDLLICQTQLMKDSLIYNLGFKPAKKVEVIPNPVNLSYITSKIVTSSKEKIIVFCGRLVEIKQPHLLIDAFSNFSINHPEYRLIFLGDGPLRAELEYQTKTLKISEKVRFLGKVKNPYAWFSKSEIGVISSRTEGFPNVLLEMMAAGTSKIVTTPCTGGLNDIPGLIVTANNSSSESILDGLNKAAMLNKSFASTYQNYVIEHHTVESFWRNTVRLLNN